VSFSVQCRKRKSSSKKNMFASRSPIYNLTSNVSQMGHCLPICWTFMVISLVRENIRICPWGELPDHRKSFVLSQTFNIGKSMSQISLLQNLSDAHLCVLHLSFHSCWIFVGYLYWTALTWPNNSQVLYNCVNFPL